MVGRRRFYGTNNGRDLALLNVWLAAAVEFELGFELLDCFFFDFFVRRAASNDFNGRLEGV